MDWIATLLSIIGIILNAKKISWCWLVWIVSNICWLVYLIPKGEMASITLWAVFLGANIYGWYSWSKDGK